MLETPLLTTFATESIAVTFPNLKNVIHRYLQGISPPITCSTLVLAREGSAEISIERWTSWVKFEPGGEAGAGAGGLGSNF